MTSSDRGLKVGFGDERNMGASEERKKKAVSETRKKYFCFSIPRTAPTWPAIGTFTDKTFQL